MLHTVFVIIFVQYKLYHLPVADPGFPVGGGRASIGGRGPLMRVLFSENVCENERIGFHRGWRVPGMPSPRSANVYVMLLGTQFLIIT